MAKRGATVLKFPYRPSDKGKPRYTIFAVEDRVKEAVERLGLRYRKYNAGWMRYEGVVIDDLQQYSELVQAMQGEAGLFNLIPEDEEYET